MRDPLLHAVEVALWRDLKSPLNMHGTWCRYGDAIIRFNIDTLPHDAMAVFQMLHYIESGALRRELPRLITESRVKIDSKSPYDTEDSKLTQVQAHAMLGEDGLLAAVIRGLRAMPSDARMCVYDRIAKQSGEELHPTFPLEVLASLIENELKQEKFLACKYVRQLLFYFGLQRIARHIFREPEPLFPGVVPI